MTRPTHVPMDAEHRALWEQILWVAAGSADLATQQAVMGHLPGCADCRDEFRFQCLVRDGVQRSEPAAHDPEPALKQFWRQVDAEEAASHRPAQASGYKLSRPWSYALAAVLALQTVGIGVLLGQLPATAPAAYTTLGSDPHTGEPAQLRIVPAPGHTLGELQALLAREGLRVVEVGSQAGHFGLAPMVPGKTLDTGTVERLRASPGLLLVQPLVQQAVSPLAPPPGSP